MQTKKVHQILLDPDEVRKELYHLDASLKMMGLEGDPDETPPSFYKDIQQLGELSDEIEQLEFIMNPRLSPKSQIDLSRSQISGVPSKHNISKEKGRYDSIFQDKERPSSSSPRDHDYQGIKHGKVHSNEYGFHRTAYNFDFPKEPKKPNVHIPRFQSGSAENSKEKDLYSSIYFSQNPKADDEFKPYNSVHRPKHTNKLWDSRPADLKNNSKFYDKLEGNYKKKVNSFENNKESSSSTINGYSLNENRFINIDYSQLGLHDNAPSKLDDQLQLSFDSFKKKFNNQALEQEPYQKTKHNMVNSHYTESEKAKKDHKIDWDNESNTNFQDLYDEFPQALADVDLSSDLSHDSSTDLYSRDKRTSLPPSISNIKESKRDSSSFRDNISNSYLSPPGSRQKKDSDNQVFNRTASAKSRGKVTFDLEANQEFIRTPSVSKSNSINYDSPNPHSPPKASLDKIARSSEKDDSKSNSIPLRAYENGLYSSKLEMDANKIQNFNTSEHSSKIGERLSKTRSDRSYTPNPDSETYIGKTREATDDKRSTNKFHSERRKSASISPLPKASIIKPFDAYTKLSRPIWDESNVSSLLGEDLPSLRLSSETPNSNSSEKLSSFHRSLASIPVTGKGSEVIQSLKSLRSKIGKLEVEKSTSDMRIQQLETLLLKTLRDRSRDNDSFKSHLSGNSFNNSDPKPQNQDQPFEISEPKSQASNKFHDTSLSDSRVQDPYNQVSREASPSFSSVKEELSIYSYPPDNHDTLPELNDSTGINEEASKVDKNSDQLHQIIEALNRLQEENKSIRCELRSAMSEVNGQFVEIQNKQSQSVREAKELYQKENLDQTDKDLNEKKPIEKTHSKPVVNHNQDLSFDNGQLGTSFDEFYDKKSVQMANQQSLNPDKQSQREKAAKKDKTDHRPSNSATNPFKSNLKLSSNKPRKPSLFPSIGLSPDLKNKGASSPWIQFSYNDPPPLIQSHPNSEDNLKPKVLNSRIKSPPSNPKTPEAFSSSSQNGSFSVSCSSPSLLTDNSDDDDSLWEKGSASPLPPDSSFLQKEQNLDYSATETNFCPPSKPSELKQAIDLIHEKTDIKHAINVLKNHRYKKVTAKNPKLPTPPPDVTVHLIDSVVTTLQNEYHKARNKYQSFLDQYQYCQPLPNGKSDLSVKDPKLVKNLEDAIKDMEVKMDQIHLLQQVQGQFFSLAV